MDSRKMSFYGTRWPCNLTCKATTIECSKEQNVLGVITDDELIINLILEI